VAKVKDIVGGSQLVAQDLCVCVCVYVCVCVFVCGGGST
jgi:hypothetical protein